MRNDIINIIINSVLVLVGAAIAMYAGGTKIDGWNVTIEKPITALLLFSAYIASFIEGH